MRLMVWRSTTSAFFDFFYPQMIFMKFYSQSFFYSTRALGTHWSYYLRQVMLEGVEARSSGVWSWRIRIQRTLVPLRRYFLLLGYFRRPRAEDEWRDSEALREELRLCVSEFSDSWNSLSFLYSSPNGQNFQFRASQRWLFYCSRLDCDDCVCLVLVLLKKFTKLLVLFLLFCCQLTTVVNTSFFTMRSDVLNLLWVFLSLRSFQICRSRSTAISKN